MRKVTLEQIFTHPIAQKYLGRSGQAHAIAVAEYALAISEKKQVDPDLAVKAALLHDIGHYEWYRDGKWDYDLYRQNDIHAIKGAARAHKLLIRLGENPQAAKEISLAVLLHTDSYLPEQNLKRDPLQQVVAEADTADEETGGAHHYKTISEQEALKRILALDNSIEKRMISKVQTS